MTDLDLDEIEARYNDWYGRGYDNEPLTRKRAAEMYPYADCGDETRSHYIVRNDLPALVDEVRRLREAWRGESEHGHSTEACCSCCYQVNAERAEAGRVREALQNRFDFEAHLARQREFSDRTFGPGLRTEGVCDHIRKELDEIKDAPTDLGEWVDVVILGLDGAGRTGASPQQIITALVAKQQRNEQREWPDWRTAPADKAIEHVRALDAALDGNEASE